MVHKLVTWANTHNKITWRYKGQQQHKESSHELRSNYKERLKAPQFLTEAKRVLDEKRPHCLNA